MENNELMELENENLEVMEDEAEKSGNGLKTVGVLALTAAVGAGLFFGTKKLIKVIKNKRKVKYIETSADEDLNSEEEE